MIRTKDGVLNCPIYWAAICPFLHTIHSQKTLDNANMTKLFGLVGFANLAAAACISSGDETTINNALKSGGAGAVVQLCPSAVITVHNTVAFTAANQELSTQGYPTDSTRAIIRLQTTDQSISAVIRGGSLSGIKLRNIQIDGDRSGNGQITAQGTYIKFMFIQSTSCQRSSS